MVHLPSNEVRNRTSSTNALRPTGKMTAALEGMSRLLTLCLVAASLSGQNAPAQNDPLDRLTPQSSILHFLEACHSRDYTKASYYLDLSHMSPTDRAKDGPDLARQLEDLLDDTPFDIATLSRQPEGDQSDGLSAGLEALDSFQVDRKTLNLQLERVALKGGQKVWLVSADSVAMIPQAHQLVAETPFEKRLPQGLVTVEVLDTPVWRWLALILLGFLLWVVAGLISRAVVAMARPLIDAPNFRDPLRTILTVAGFRGVLELAPPSAIVRLFIERSLGLIFSLALAWGAAVAVDLLASRWNSRLDPRVQAVSYSVLPLGRQVLKLCLFLIAILSVLSAWGYNTSTILAGLGVGGLAVALAAQKTIENLFGGISVIGDRPVLVGDTCRFGDKTGTVMHIGLRSTRLRTGDRTVICVPNGQFSSMALENISVRDKILFDTMLNLRRDTTPDQLQQVLSSIRSIMENHPKLDPGKNPVSFVKIGTYSLDIQATAYVKTSDDNEFATVRQDLLIRILQAVEQAGTALAVPLQESVNGHRSTENG
jgi:MscS family membrane protein